MSVFKCKMCGGTLEIHEHEGVVECEYCGTLQTLSKNNNETIQNLFSRANNLRLKCEFDKAEQIYEKILELDNTEAEAYWGLVLCKYGIEYVDDPATGEKIPTCHRSSFDSILEDPEKGPPFADIPCKIIGKTCGVFPCFFICIVVFFYGFFGLQHRIRGLVEGIGNGNIGYVGSGKGGFQFFQLFNQRGQCSRRFAAIRSNLDIKFINRQSHRPTLLFLFGSMALTIIYPNKVFHPGCGFFLFFRNLLGLLLFGLFFVPEIIRLFCIFFCSALFGISQRIV